MAAFADIPVAHPFEQLGDAFHTKIRLSPLENVQIVHLNHKLGKDLGLGWLKNEPEQLAKIFNGEHPLGDATPLSSIYAGHQFGSWVSQLGDGRAAMLAQVRDSSGQLWEIQSKGGGPTPYSRHADGRAVLRSSIREYLCSEAMHGLGIATTRSLALLDSSTQVFRETVERGAILIRVAPSHIRFGHFELFASRNQHQEVKQLADYLLEQYFPHLGKSENPYLDLYQEVIQRTAITIAQWQAVGFCHGVMNTDNMSVLGLTLDYGPYGFLEAYDPVHICNHSDHGGRYAYANQPRIAQWNLACLGNALLSLVSVESAQEALESYPETFEKSLRDLMSAKMGLNLENTEHQELAQKWLVLMRDQQADYTQSFRGLTDLAGGDKSASQLLDQHFSSHPEWHVWQKAYQQAQTLHAKNHADLVVKMQNSNPVYVLRNSFAQGAIEQAEMENYAELETLFHLLRTPYQRQSGAEAYETPSSGSAAVVVSCSS